MFFSFSTTVRKASAVCNNDSQNVTVFDYLEIHFINVNGVDRLYEAYNKFT